MSDQDDKNLLEVVKRNGDFVKHYGRWRGAFLYWLSMRATRPRSLRWAGLVAVGVGIVGWWIKSRGTHIIMVCQYFVVV